MKLYVGNLSYRASEDEIRQAFQGFGAVGDVTIIKDRETGRSKGFAFVDMNSQEAGEAAIAAMNGKDFGGRNITVNEARPKTEGSTRSYNSAPRRSFGNDREGGYSANRGERTPRRNNNSW